MRKRFRVLLLASIVAAVVVPVGFALSLESGPSRIALSRSVATTTVSSAQAAPAVVPLGYSTIASIVSPLPDGAKLFFVGTVLIGLAAAVRKAI